MLAGERERHMSDQILGRLQAFYEGLVKGDLSPGDALFDFDKYVLKAEGKKSIDDAIAKMAKVDVEMVIATGHTDSIGTDKYNQRLSERRANTVKEYMVSKGIPAAKITTLGKGESQPVATNKTKEGRAKNRRVDIEFKGVTQK